MTDKPVVNPYAAPESVDDPRRSEAFLEPICFRARWTEQDLLEGMRNAPSGSFGAWPFVLLVLSPFLLAVFAGGDPLRMLNPFVWMILMTSTSFIWWSTLNVLGPMQRKARKRAKKIADHRAGHYKTGWVDAEGVFIDSEVSVYRARWEFFVHSILLPNHSLLVCAHDQSHRVVLPNRGFASATDCQRVREFLFKRIPMQGHKKQKIRQLKRVVFAGEDVAKVAPGPDERWGDDWPLPVAPTQGQDFVISGLESQNTTQWLSIVMTLGFFLFPVWTVTVVWLFFERWQFGGWDFLVSEWLENLWMQVPALGLTGLFLWAMASNHFNAKNAAKQILRIRLTDVGFSTEWMQLKCWNLWSEVETVIDEEDRTGVKMRVDAEELAFPKESFEDEQAFQQFRECLGAWAKQTSTDAATASAEPADDHHQVTETPRPT